MPNRKIWEVIRAEWEILRVLEVGFGSRCCEDIVGRFLGSRACLVVVLDMSE